MKNNKEACNIMMPQHTYSKQLDMYRTELSSMLNPNDPLVILANAVPWDTIERELRQYFSHRPGRPPKPIRLIVGIFMLQHMEGVSDEKAIKIWSHNPYWQYFCGFNAFQLETPLNPSSLSRWRKKIGEKGMQTILSSTVTMAIEKEVIKEKELENVIVDTTVMESNIRFPFDAQLLNRCRKQLVKEAEKCKIKLRQSYARVGTHLERKCSRYAHAKQYKRLNNHVKKLKTLLGRTIRDIQRHLEKDYQSNECLDDLLLMGIRLFNQEKTTKNKLYSLHEPSAYCISKGKRKAPFEFGFKAPFVVSHKMGLILAALSLEKNAHDGHTLRASIEQAERITGRKINKIFVDRGYRGHGIEDKKVYISGQRKGMTPTLIKELKRRSAIEPHIGHMKSDGKLKRNYLKGIIGSKINALLCAIGHNLRMICRHIINIFVKILASLFAQFVIQEQCAWH